MQRLPSPVYLLVQLVESVLKAMRANGQVNAAEKQALIKKLVG